MKTKELKIEAPERYEVDWENSSMNTIRFKPVKKKITYQDVKEKLFADTKYYYIESAGTIISSKNARYYGENIIVATSKQQIEQLLALNKLMNVAKYLNGDWEADFTNARRNWYIGFDFESLMLGIRFSVCYRYSDIYFKSKELALQAIEILGEEEVKKALGIFE